MNIHTIFLPCINFNSKPLFVCQKIKGFNFHLIKNTYIFHAFIWLSEEEKNYCRALLLKMLKLRVLDLFFHRNICFVVTQRVTYRKMVSLSTGTEFQVPIQVMYQFICERYPNLIVWHKADTTDIDALTCVFTDSQQWPSAITNRLTK